MDKNTAAVLTTITEELYTAKEKEEELRGADDCSNWFISNEEIYCLIREDCKRRCC